MNNLFFTILYALFFISTLYLRIKIRKKTLNSERIKGKIIASWTTKYIFFIYLLILFGSLVEYFIVQREINLYLSFSSVILYIIGIAGRQWAFNSLGKYWSVNIEIRDEHEIIREGPYKFMRHPNNFFHSIEVLAITLIPNSYYSLAIFVAAYFPVLILRSIIEEKAMTESLQERYRNYRKEVWGFLPLPIKKRG